MMASRHIHRFQCRLTLFSCHGCLGGQCIIFWYFFLASSSQRLELAGRSDAYAVALENCLVNIYTVRSDKKLALSHAICMSPDIPITAMIFGPFDRQKDCLLGMTQFGDLHLLTLHRGAAIEANFDGKVLEMPMPANLRKVKPRKTSSFELVSHKKTLCFLIFRVCG